MYIPPAWSRWDGKRKITAIVLIAMPYLFLYLSAYTNPGTITAASHASDMTLYPYDFINFFPGQTCATCRRLKPARSKHCSICNRCISRLDHHCIFINNCVGYGNHHWFLLLLLSTTFLTTYGAFTGSELVTELIRERYQYWTPLGQGYSWRGYFNTLAWALQAHTRVGAVTMLCTLTTPLVAGLFLYHLYLLWAGTTTNESMKWSDWKADIADGWAYQRPLAPGRIKDERREARYSSWPVEARMVMCRVEDGSPPLDADGDEDSYGDGPWRPVWSLQEVENVYDVGLGDALRDVFFKRINVVWDSG